MPPDLIKTIEESLKTVSSDKRADFKASEMVKVGPVTKERVQFSNADYQIEIVSITKITKGVEVLARAWMPDETKIGFGKDGSVEIERFRIINPPVLVKDPLGTIIRTWTESDGREMTKTLREDPKLALLQTLASTISVKKEVFDDKNIVLGKVGNTTLTQYPDAGTTGPMDGGFIRINANTFTSVRDGAGTHDTFTDTAANFIEVRATATTDEYNVLTRSGFSFDTSTISTDTISSATLSLWSNADTADNDFGVDPDCDIVSFTPATADYLISDYAKANFGTTVYSAVAFSTFRTGVDGYVDFSLDASGIAYIDPDGTTHFGARVHFDTDNTEPTWASNDEARINCSLSDLTGETEDPKLVVEHSAASNTGAFFALM